MACSQEERALLNLLNFKCDRIEFLLTRVEKLNSGNYEGLPLPEPLEKLSSEISRLKYRIAILEKAVAEAGRNSAVVMAYEGELSLMQKLKRIFEFSLSAAFPDQSGLTVSISEVTRGHFGDYQINSAMGIAKMLKANSREVAEKILAALPTHPLMQKVEIAGPGFINVRLNDEYVFKQVISMFLNGVKPPVLPPRRVVVDLSSPNIAKEMHVGHLRSTIIGDAICRLLEFVGFDVLRLNHVGDWGTQFGMLITNLQDRFPNYLQEAPPLADLQAFYREAKLRFDNEEDFKQRALEAVVKLQNYEKDHMHAWSLICEVSRKDFQSIYDRLDVELIERGESFYQDKMADVVRLLEEKGLVEYDEGRKLVFPAGMDVPLTVEKSGGGYTYDTSDLAALRHRLVDEKADWVIYVVDAGQTLHFQQLFTVGKQLGLFDDSTHRVCHTPFGLVLGDDRKKFRTRSGETVKLRDLLDEGVKRAREKLIEKDRHKTMTPEEFEAAQNAVAYGCIKYADLSHNRVNDYVFSFDRMLDDKGNTAAYLLYAYTRIRSIARNAGVSREELRTIIKANDIRFGDEKELKLAKAILKFSDVLLLALDTFLPSYICDYLYMLACTFTEFYDNCYCIERDASGNTVKINFNRLILCEVTADVIAAGFSILGIRPIEKM